MHDMMKRHEVQVLRRAGVTQAKVAELTGISERAVRMIEAEELVVVPDDEAEREKRGIGRPSKAEPFRGFIAKLLAEDPDLLSLEFLRRARLEGYRGGKSAMYALIASLRPRPVRPMVRFEGLPGEFVQHDFGHVDVRFMDGTTKRIHFFGSRLKYSRWVEVTIVPDEQVETLVRRLVDHFTAFGGVPLLSVFDRPKTVALHWKKDGSVTEWNPTFAAVMLDLGVGVEICWPARGNQKGSVENLVGWVKGSFFKQRRFLDEADLLSQLAAWLEEVNTKVPSRATGVTPAVRMAEERARLRPLKVVPTDLALRIPVSAGPTGYVLHDTHLYSMPPDAIGIPGTLFLYQDRVKIVAGRFSALHPRLFERNAKSTLPEHRADAVAKVSGKRGKRYLMREHLLEVGGDALDYLTEITHRRPGAWVGEVEQLHTLLQQHGADALRGAIGRAVAGQTFGVEYVRHYLRQPDSASRQEVLPL
ncbi:MAG TPA: IS21 family transposase [Anaeromyxobacteraceae bacterium]|nr:IS21 family transposase [Anaeromyxobacteraceae bacterium]